MRTSEGIASAVAAVNRDPSLLMRLLSELDLEEIAKAETAGIHLRRSLEALHARSRTPTGDLAFTGLEDDVMSDAYAACALAETLRHTPVQSPVPSSAPERGDRPGDEMRFGRRRRATSPPGDL